MAYCMTCVPKLNCSSPHSHILINSFGYQSIDPLGSLSLISGYILDRTVVIPLRSRHQPKFTSQAVRKLGRLSSILGNNNDSEYGDNVLPAEPTIREALIKKLASYLPSTLR